MGCHFLPHQKSKITCNSLVDKELALSPLLFTRQFIRKMLIHSVILMETVTSFPTNPLNARLRALHPGYWENHDCVLITQSCPTLYEPVDWGPPGSSGHGILQASILEWVAMPFSRGSSWPRDWICVFLSVAIIGEQNGYWGWCKGCQEFLPIPVASEIIWGKYNWINRKTFVWW